MSDFKSAPRIKDPALLRALKIEYTCCEITFETGVLPLHHVIFKSQRGDDVRANIVCLVERLHLAVHAGDPKAKCRLAQYIHESRPDVAEYIDRKLDGETPLLAWYERHGLKGVVHGKR